MTYDDVICRCHSANIMFRLCILSSISHIYHKSTIEMQVNIRVVWILSVHFYIQNFCSCQDSVGWFHNSQAVASPFGLKTPPSVSCSKLGRKTWRVAGVFSNADSQGVFQARSPIFPIVFPIKPNVFFVEKPLGFPVTPLFFQEAYSSLTKGDHPWYSWWWWCQAVK